jgi:hypothetical protein
MGVRSKSGNGGSVPVNSAVSTVNARAVNLAHGRVTRELVLPT